jgi:hypothetical protein
MHRSTSNTKSTNLGRAAARIELNATLEQKSMQFRAPILVVCFSIVTSVALGQSRLRVLRHDRNETEKDSTRIAVAIPTRFTASRTSEQVIVALARALPPVLDTLDQSIPIRTLIAERYGTVSDSQASNNELTISPRLVFVLDSLIRVLNRIGASSVVRRGEILLPSIPRSRSLQSETAGSSLLAVKRLRASIVAYSQTSGRPGRLTVDTTQILVGEHMNELLSSIHADSVELSYSVSTNKRRTPNAAFSEAVKLRAARTDKSPVALTVASSKPTQEDIDSGGLPEDLLCLVSSVAANVAPKRSVPLFILDSGWPDSLSRVRSREWIHDMIDTVRAAWGLPVRIVGSDEETPFEKPFFPHAEDVNAAIVPFTLAATSGENITPVIVVFLPLTRDQESEQLLKELLLSSELLESRLTSVAVPCRAARTLAEQEKCARGVKRTLQNPLISQEVQKRLTEIPKQLGPAGAGGRTFMSSGTILTAAWRLLSAYSLHTGTMPVVSVSWTVSGLVPSFDLDGRIRPHPLLVAAVGNDEQMVSENSSRELAWRATKQGEVLGTMNVRPDGRAQCRSASIKRVEGQEPMLTGFSGMLAEHTSCGTSFAAPRVAWLAAFDEAFRGKGEEFGAIHTALRISQNFSTPRKLSTTSNRFRRFDAVRFLCARFNDCKNF